MADRLSLHSTLKTILGSSNVYYQSPSSNAMKYPAIVYSKSPPDVRHANNGIYGMKQGYEIIVISDKPDHAAIAKIQSLPYSRWVRNYVSDNLHHDVLTLYY